MPRDTTPQCYLWLRPPPAVREALDTHRRQWLWPKGRHLPAAHRLHLTLHVLGALDEAQIAALQHALPAVRVPAFELLLDWSGVWTGAGVAVACPRPSPALQRLHEALAQALPAALRPPQSSRTWTPHVTLAWQALGAGAPVLPPLRWPVRDFLFVRSWLPPHAVRHEELGRYELD